MREMPLQQSANLSGNHILPDSRNIKNFNETFCQEKKNDCRKMLFISEKNFKKFEGSVCCAHTRRSRYI